MEEPRGLVLRTHLFARRRLLLTSPGHGVRRGGLSLRKGTAQSTSGATALKFWVHGGTGAAKSLLVYTQTADTGGESASVVSAPANTWTEITVSLSSLGNPLRLNFQENSGATQPMAAFDEIRSPDR